MSGDDRGTCSLGRSPLGRAIWTAQHAVSGPPSSALAPGRIAPHHRGSAQPAGQVINGFGPVPADDRDIARVRPAAGEGQRGKPRALVGQDGCLGLDADAGGAVSGARSPSPPASALRGVPLRCTASVRDGQLDMLVRVDTWSSAGRPAGSVMSTVPPMLTLPSRTEPDIPDRRAAACPKAVARVASTWRGIIPSGSRFLPRSRSARGRGIRRSHPAESSMAGTGAARTSGTAAGLATATTASAAAAAPDAAAVAAAQTMAGAAGTPAAAAAVAPAGTRARAGARTAA